MAVQHIIKLVAASFSLFILWVIYLANTGASSSLFHLVAAIPYGDKLGHLLLFGSLSCLMIVASRFYRLKLFGKQAYLGAILVSLFVIAEEFSQAFIATRTFDFTDLLFDAIGIGLSVIVCCKLQQRLDTDQSKTL
ncbi:trypsin [Shewanella sp. WXL01]|uniref:VanZ family protein n=1 Tax=Shewanella sp. WXL01 TaxID=2709721 RepID=UPI0014386BA0|nr:VanZ family protein [Shewanella sp. WXL01]NKF49315.1 trypsin [Shewanella sp. WXL01]